VIKFKVYRKILLVGQDLGEDLQQKLKQRARGLQIHMPISAKKGKQIVMVNNVQK
jgi:hypothetical protein